MKTEKKPSLWRCLWRMSWSMMVLSGVLKLLADGLIYVPPICLDLIVTFVIKTEINGTYNASIACAKQDVSFTASFDNTISNQFYCLVNCFISRYDLTRH
jgi:hypothetical protein